MKRAWMLVALAAVAFAGCIALSPEERRQLGRLKEHGYGMESPPPGFEPPVGEWTAAGLNALPGIGNFYLAQKGGGGWQWVLGAGNLLLWPISPLWAVAEGGIDARTLNERAMLVHCRELAKAGRKLPSRSGANGRGMARDREEGNAEEEPGRTGRRMDAPPPRAPYEIVTEGAFEGGRAVFRVDIRDDAATAFQIVREVRPEIEKVLRDAFAAESPGVKADDVQVYVVPEFGANRSIRFRAWAFAVRPLATDGWKFNPQTRHGEVRLRISGGMPAEEAKRWARENIEAIVKEKNVALEAGEAPPEGAVYRSLGESLENGVLTVEFEAVE